MASYYMMTIALFSIVNAFTMISSICITGPALVSPSLILAVSTLIVLLLGMIGWIGCWKERKNYLLT
ncbi:hypothetical protein GJ496_001274, partial [Pomphorhynchus laevis]